MGLLLVYVGGIVEVVGSCRYCGWCSGRVCTVGSGVTDWNHLKFIVHIVSYGIAVVVFSVKWTVLLLLLGGIISDRFGVILLEMFN